MTNAPKAGDKVHYWSKVWSIATGGHSAICWRCVIRSVDGKYARVERLNGPTAVPVQAVPLVRLKPGWNNWVDHEGRPIDDISDVPSDRTVR